MRLLFRSDNDEYRLTKDLFGNDLIPPYAILSHTWLADTEEPSFKDLTDGTGKNKLGYEKIRFCGEQARQDGLRYFWVDTCCIDKTNSTELTEAINSMFSWYQKAARCFVYLSDVSAKDDSQDKQQPQNWEAAFRRSRWFRRGWTLQELLAPPHVELFSAEGTLLGDKSLLKSQIHEITRIPIDALQGRCPQEYSIMERFKWIEHRATTRGEDKAYSLLGLFNVSMPLIYGEGFKRAFRRLREEVNKHSSHAYNGFENGQVEYSHIYRNTADERVFAPRKVDYPTIAPRQEIEERLLQHLKFSAIRDREERISRALTDTFEWIYLEHVSEDVKWTCFVRWLQSDNGLYWITGKAGSGKSTLMKFLHLDPRTASYLKNWARGSKLVIAGHFFWNSGNSTQMSFEGLVRTLLYEIVQSEAISLPDLFPERWKELQSNSMSGRTSKKMQPWTTSECLRTFRRLLLHPFNTLRFFFFIDGLDEFGGDHTELIELLKEMADSPHIKMCVASRPWSVFQDAFDTGPSLTLQHLTHQDIKLYVHTKFYKSKGFLELAKGNPQLAAQLTESITDKASGVFLWVRLAVQSLLLGLRNGDRIIDLTKRLEDLPEDLEMLFRKILDSIDPAYKEHSSQLFQVHRAGLDNAGEVNLLLLSYADDDEQALWEEGDALLGSDEFLYRMKSMERRLDSRTKGLLEAPSTSFKHLEPQLRSHPDSWSQLYAYEQMNPKVQYLHRTLKDYIEQPGTWTQICSSAPSFSPYPSLCKAYALQIKGMDFRMNESLEDEHSLFGSWFRDVKKNAVSLCKLANSSEWKRSDIVDALNAILTRKIAGRD